MSYYKEPDIHISDKVKVVVDLSNYATKKDSTALKAKVNKLDIDKLVNIPNSLNNRSNCSNCSNCS